MKIARYRVGEVVHFDGVGTIISSKEDAGQIYHTIEWDRERLPVSDIIESSCYPEEMPDLYIKEKVKEVIRTIL